MLMSGEQITSEACMGRTWNRSPTVVLGLCLGAAIGMMFGAALDAAPFGLLYGAASGFVLGWLGICIVRKLVRPNTF